MRLPTWLVAVMIAACGCAATSEPIMTSRPDARPPVRSLPSPETTQSGCRETAHQPFPADEPGPALDRAPETLTKVPPSYPQDAREQGVQGLVQLRALVCEHGHVVRTVVVTSVPLLDESAREAASRWVFRPAERAGQLVAAWVDVPVRFSIH